jgi:hypothetical protein
MIQSTTQITKDRAARTSLKTHVLRKGKAVPVSLVTKHEFEAPVTILK